MDRQIGPEKRLLAEQGQTSKIKIKIKEVILSVNYKKSIKEIQNHEINENKLILIHLLQSIRKLLNQE